jgi:hypothetical protein
MRQDVKKNTEKVMKELASQEKREVQLREKQKHALSQQKKLKKSINEVRLSSFLSFLSLRLLVQTASVVLTRSSRFSVLVFAGYPRSIGRLELGREPRGDDREDPQGAREVGRKARGRGEGV